MSSNLPRSQAYYQLRKKQSVAMAETDYAGAAAAAAAAVARPQSMRSRSVSIIRQGQPPAAGHWTPWVLDSKGMYYWSAMRKPDGSVAYSYANNRDQPLHARPSSSSPDSDSRMASSSSPEVTRIGLHSHGYAASPSPHLATTRPLSARATSVSNTSSASSSSTNSGSYLSLYYQDMLRKGHVGERTKLDMRVSRWLASLA